MQGGSKPSSFPHTVIDTRAFSFHHGGAMFSGRINMAEPSGSHSSLATTTVPIGDDHHGPQDQGEDDPLPLTQHAAPR